MGKIKDLFIKLKTKFINFCKWVWEECKDWHTVVIFAIVVVVMYSPVWGGYLCHAVFGWKWCSVVATSYLCTVRIGRRLLPNMSHKLNSMCDYYGIELDHHHAGSDSLACAKILLQYIESGTDITQFIRTYSF